MCLSRYSEEKNCKELGKVGIKLDWGYIILYLN